ncbi:MAG: adenosine deaminase [Verrucomicrobiota bacterium]
MNRAHSLKGLTGQALSQALDFRALPKVLLHEHLDGGLRPATVIELARENGYHGLPTQDPEDLATWFHRGAKRGNLPEYLEGFAHTIAVMQTAEALERVAYEFLEDMAADGVFYAEIRFAPVFHTEAGLTQDEVVAAVVAGLTRGGQAFGVEWGVIICAMRNRRDSLEAAQLAISWRGRGVVGFDLAGEEAGYPPKDHLEAFQTIHRANFNITLHAGEAFGKESIWQALQWCGAHRLGHGTRLVEDFIEEEPEVLRPGSLARYVLDHRIPLEMCLSSNVDTGACPSLATHPFPLFLKSGFRVSLNTDDRLMSDTELSREYRLATETFDLSWSDLEKITLNAMKSAFAPHAQRVDLISRIILPAYADHHPSPRHTG